MMRSLSIALPNGGLLAVSVDGVFHVPCYDHNGNVVRYVSETGTASAQYVYDPYGNAVESSGPLAGTFAFGFSTKCRDRETGLVGVWRPTTFWAVRRCHIS